MYSQNQYDRFSNSDNPTAMAFQEIDHEIVRGIKGLFSFVRHSAQKSNSEIKSGRKTVSGQY